MKRTPLKRKKPFRWTKPKRRRVANRLRSKHARRERAPAFMAWTSRQTCMVARFFEPLNAFVGKSAVIYAKHLWCAGPIQVDHAGNRFTDGDGVRAFDRTVIPMCRKHHDHRTNAGGTPGQAGIFYGFTAEQVRAWSDEAVRIHQALARENGVQIPKC